MPPSITELDIDTDAISALNSSCRAVKVILDRRAQLDMQGMKDETLVVLAGEVHTIPADQLHHILVVDGLQKQEPDIVVTCERSHDLLASKFSEHAGMKVTVDIKDRLRTHDKSGMYSLKTQMGLHPGFENADFSHFSFYNALLRRNIPTRFIDTSSLMPGRVNYMDSSSDKSLRCCLGDDVHSNVHTKSAQGIYVRNHHMFYQALNFIDEHRPRIVFAQCGNTHVLGKKGKDEYVHSLAALFKEAGVPVIAMPIFSYNGLNDRTVPDDHKLEKEEQLFLPFISGINALYGDRKNKNCEKADIQSAFVESAFFNAMLRRVGFNDDCISLTRRDEIKNELSEEMKQTFRQWKREIRPSLWSRAVTRLKP